MTLNGVKSHHMTSKAAHLTGPVHGSDPSAVAPALVKELFLLHYLHTGQAVPGGGEGEGEGRGREGEGEGRGREGRGGEEGYWMTCQCVGRAGWPAKPLTHHSQFSAN